MNTIEKVVELSDQLQKECLSQSENTAEVKSELSHLRKIKRALLPVERGNPEVMQLTERIRGLAEQHRVMRLGLGPYPPFALDALTWRNADGWPLLAVFSIDKPTISIGTQRYTWGANRVGYWKQCRPELPPVLKRQYLDVFAQTKELAQEERKSIKLEATFRHFVPQDVKDELRVIEDSFSSMWMVAEVDEWEVKREPTLPTKDPLVIGVKGLSVMLIASFDPTSLESLVEGLSLS